MKKIIHLYDKLTFFILLSYFHLAKSLVLPMKKSCILFRYESLLLLDYLNFGDLGNMLINYSYFFFCFECKFKFSTYILRAVNTGWIKNEILTFKN